MSAFSQQKYSNDKRKWGSIGLSVNKLFMFNDWFDNPEMRDYVGTYPYPHVQANLNVRVFKEFGAFFNIGLGSNKRKGVADNYNAYSSINLNDYYQEVLFHKSDRGLIIHGDIGFYHKFFYKKWVFIPYIGMKMMDFNPSMLSYTLKEKGSNDKLVMDYGWGSDKGFREDKGSSSLSFKFKTERKLSKHFNLDFGIELNVLMNNVYYREKVSNYYTKEVLHYKEIKANRLSSIGLILGVNFR